MTVVSPHFSSLPHPSNQSSQNGENEFRAEDAPAAPPVALLLYNVALQTSAPTDRPTDRAEAVHH